MRRNKGNGKSPLEHHSGNCSRQNPWRDAKISGQKFKQKENIMQSLSISPKIFSHEERNSNFIVENPSRCHLNQVNKVNTPVIHKDIMDSLAWCRDGLVKCVLSIPIIYRHNLIIRKKSNKPPNEGHSTKYLGTTLQKYQSHQRQGNTELSQITD